MKLAVVGVQVSALLIESLIALIDAGNFGVDPSSSDGLRRGLRCATKSWAILGDSWEAIQKLKIKRGNNVGCL